MEFKPSNKKIMPPFFLVPISQKPKNVYIEKYLIQSVTILPSPVSQNSFSTVGGIGVGGLLPLSLEMIGTGVSRLTMGALRVERGAAGGEQKDASSREV